MGLEFVPGDDEIAIGDVVVHGQSSGQIRAFPTDNNHVGRRGYGVGNAVFSVQADLNREPGGVGVVTGDAGRCDQGSVRDFGCVVDDSWTMAAPQEGFAGDVADAGIDRNAQGALLAQTLHGLNVGEAHQDAVAGLEVAELQREEVFALGFSHGGAAAFGFGFLVKFSRSGAFLDLGQDDATVDVHLAAVDGGIGRQREDITAIEGVFVGLFEELVDLHGGEARGDLGIDRDGAEREKDTGGFEPAFEAKRFVGIFVETVVHLVTGACFCRMRLIAVT